MVINEKKKVNDEGTCAARKTTSANKPYVPCWSYMHAPIYLFHSPSCQLQHKKKLINIIVAEFIQLQIQTVTYDPLVKPHQEQYKAHT